MFHGRKTSFWICAALSDPAALAIMTVLALMPFAQIGSLQARPLAISMVGTFARRWYPSRRSEQTVDIGHRLNPDRRLLF